MNAYNGATFTPGDFEADSGQRNVGIEFTIDGNSITTGTVGAFVFSTTSLPINSETQNSAIIGQETYYHEIDNASPVTLIFVAVTSDGDQCIGSVTVINGAPDAADRYVCVLLPTGEIIASDAISVPGIGGGGPG